MKTGQPKRLLRSLAHTQARVTRTSLSLWLTFAEPRKYSFSTIESEGTWHPRTLDQPQAGTSQWSRPPEPVVNNCHEACICRDAYRDLGQGQKTQALGTIKEKFQETISARPYSRLSSLRLISSGCQRIAKPGKMQGGDARGEMQGCSRQI